MSIEKLKTEVRRDQIAQAALGLIASQGMSEFKIAGLSRRVGVAPSAIYHHFKNKDEIVDAVLGLLEKRLLGNVKAVMEKSSDPLAQLKEILFLHVKLILEHSALPRILFSEEIYGGKPERKAKLNAIILSYLDEVARIIREGQQQNRIRSDIQASTLSVMFLGLVQPIAILWHLSDGAFDAAKQVERAWPVFSESIVFR
jgi:AcrR family transcriptional regulator